MATAPTAEVSVTSRVCVVGCKLPNGLILRVHQKVKRQELVMGGGFREVDSYEPIGPAVRLYGNAVPRGAVPSYVITPGGYALTVNVDAEFMTQWLDEHKLDPIVINKLIFRAKNPQEAVAMAKEYAEIQSGLEPLNVSTDSKGRPVDSRVKAISRRSDNLTEVKKYDKRDEAA